ncbi:serine--tRNA ligase, partial [Candidatus Dependentiae bacterium HGW-Dependentiae-1]
MIDLALLRETPAEVIALLKKKEPRFDVEKLLELDTVVRELRSHVEELRHTKNELAKKAQAGITDALRQESISMGKELKEKEERLAQVQAAFHELYLGCPNIPETDLPEGGKEANKVVKVVGTKPAFSFPVKNHLDLGEALGWLDFQAAAKMSGANLALYKGDAVKLLYALSMFMLKNNMKHGYSPVLPPEMVNEKSLEVTGNFPKFKDQAFAIPEDKLFMTPTAEVNLTNLYRDTILMADQLPVRMTAWTSCFRREGGAYGSAERGLIRIRQFEKVELVSICEPQNAQQELDRMVACAEDILQQLGLHYRISLLAAQDCSFASARTFDIEVWLPGQGPQGTYYEVSSCSNCTDFQARRGMIRYKKNVDDKTTLVYTLNGSSLALPRLMVAIMENYQQPDGSIVIPEVLKHEG